MNKMIAVDQLLAAISEAYPSGEDLRYTTFYDDIKEARRFEDPFTQGDWQREVKTSDWDRVITLSVTALSERSKDLQIAAWLTEALTVAEGFEGLDLGLRLCAGFLERFWDTVYPLIHEGDLAYRAAPFDFLNDRVAVHVKQVPLTDKRFTPGYSWLKWQQACEVGSEAETRNRCGDVDDEKKRRREERIAEGAVTIEAFDAAIAQSESSFSQALFDSLNRCQEAFKVLDGVVEEKFGRDAPRLAELGAAIEACLQLGKRIQPDLKVDAARVETSPASGPLKSTMDHVFQVSSQPDTAAARAEPLVQQRSVLPAATPADHGEISVWEEALRTLDAGQFRGALGMLLFAGNSSASTRDRNRFRLLMVKLCLKAGRGDLARPIIEELYAMIEELHLEHWESPLWIAEVLEAYYQCLQVDEPPNEDLCLSRELFRRICALDATKAIAYRI